MPIDLKPSDPQLLPPLREEVFTPPRHQVVVIGSGFGGVAATKALRDADVDVTVIGRTTSYLFQPLLYQVATGLLSPGKVAPAARQVLARQSNAQVLCSEVHRINLANRTVRADSRGGALELRYDTLIVAAGATTSYFGQDHFEEFAPGMKTIDDALELRGRIYGAFEMAELAASRGDAVDHLLTFVVIGAGPTGVELAGQLISLARRTLRHQFHHIDPAQARVVLVDAASQVLPAMGTALGARAHHKLASMGVEVLLETKVVAVDEDGIETLSAQGLRHRIGSSVKVWAAGVQASALGASLAAQSGAAVDRSGRVEVTHDLSLPGCPEVFVVGDMMRFHNLPATAQVAMQSARHVARCLRHRRAGFDVPDESFTYRDMGSMAMIGRFSAVAQVGRVRLAGLTAWVLWLALHLVYLTGLSNRMATLCDWSVSFLRGRAPERTFTEQQTYGRVAVARAQRSAPAPTLAGEVAVRPSRARLAPSAGQVEQSAARKACDGA